MKKKVLLFIATVVIYAPGSMAQVPTDYTFAVKAGGSGTDEGKAMATDANGNVYVAGYFKGSATFGTLPAINSAGNHDAFLAKYDSTGNAIWARSYGGTGSDYGNGIASDGTDMYLTGTFFSAASFGTNTLTANGQSDVFILKMNGAGTISWLNKAGSTIADNGKGIAVNSSGNIFITGTFSGTATFYGSPNVTLTTTGLTDVYTAKYDNSGNVLWAKKGGGSNNEYPYGIGADINGNSFITGFYSSTTATFSPQSLSNSGNGDIYVVKYDASGNVLWAKDIGAAGYDYAYGLTVDEGANVIVTGGFGGTVMFGSSSLTSSNASTEDMFITKLDNGGNFLWTMQAGTTTADYVWGNAVITGANGDIFATGSFEATASFGTNNLTSNGGDETYGEDVFVCKIDQQVSPILSLAENSDAPLQLFPVPAVDEFTLVIPAGNYSIAITDLWGRSVYAYDGQTLTGNFPVSLEGISSGVYLVTVKNKNGKSRVTRLVVQK